MARAKTMERFRALLQAMLAALLLIPFAIVLTWRLSPAMSGPNFDSTIFRYLGMLWYHGAVTYADVFLYAAPLIGHVAALGRPFGDWGLWLVDLAFAVAAGMVVVRALRAGGFSSPVLGAVAIVLALRFPGTADDVAQTRFYSTIFQLMVALACWLKPARGAFAAGLFGALAFFTIPTEVLPLVPLVALAYFASIQDARDSIRSLALGGLLALGILLLPPTLAGKPLAFVEGLFRDHYFGAALFSASHGSILDRVLEGIEVLREKPYFGLSLAVFILNLALPIALRTPWGVFAQGACLSVAIALQLVSTSLAGNFWVHYWHGFLGWVALSCLFCLSLIEKRLGFSYRLVTPLVLAVAIFGTRPEFWSDAVGQVRDFWGRNRWTESYERYSKLLPAFEKRHGNLYTVGCNQLLFLNVREEILLPSAFCTTSFWETRYWGPRSLAWDPDRAKFRQLLGSLEAARTEVVIDCTKSNPLMPDVQELWDRYVDARYTVFANAYLNAYLDGVWQIGNLRVLRRKPGM